MPSKMTSLALLGVAAYGTSTASTAFSAIGGAPAGRVAERSFQLGQQPMSSAGAGPSTGPSAGIAGACVLGVVSAALGAARAGKRSARRAAVPRAAEKSLTDRLMGSGPESIQAGKDTCSFATLLAALGTAGLVEALGGPGPFTLFAPDDKAFEGFLAGANLTPAQLLANPDLAKILKNHVCSGSITAKDFKNTVLTTLAGTSITMKKGVKGVTVGGAIIKKPDILAGNGVIHIMSGVMMP